MESKKSKINTKYALASIGGSTSKVSSFIPPGDGRKERLRSQKALAPELSEKKNVHSFPFHFVDFLDLVACYAH